MDRWREDEWAETVQASDAPGLVVPLGYRRCGSRSGRVGAHRSPGPWGTTSIASLPGQAYDASRTDDDPRQTGTRLRRDGRRALQEADAPGLTDAQHTERLTRAQTYMLAHVADSLEELTGQYGVLRTVASTMDQLNAGLNAMARRFGDQ